jgi:hypothetical protein
MALKIPAEAVRALIPDGVYSLQLLEQRDGQRIVLTFSLASRSGGHTIQIETSEVKVMDLFQHLLPGPSPASQGPQRSRTVPQRRARAEAAQEQRSTATPTMAESPPAERRLKRQRRQPR